MKRTGHLLFGLSVLFLFGCAHTQKSGDSTGSVKEVESYRLTDPEPPQVADQELESIPTEMNDRVEQWISYFQHKGRPHMERYLARSTRYVNLMKRILRENGLPEDLIYIALIESGFSSRATSRAAAVGFWQFIKPTGRRYGLEISALVDERRDPVLATQAAAEYFKGLYSVFGSWYLSMASYNVGENRVKREIMAHYTRDFWELARKKRFPKETINYIPKFIAAKMIAKNPEKYGFTSIEYEKPVEFEMIKVDKPLNMKLMAAKMGLDYDDFRQLNPKFRGEIAPLKGNGLLELRIPVGQASVAMNAAKESFVEKVEFVADAGDTQTYKIRSGDSLYTIARKYHTTVSVLRDINDLKAGRKLRIGMRIQVPERASHKGSKTVVARREEKVNKPDDNEKVSSSVEVTKNGVVFYVVQQGDTLSAIADDYDSSIAELRKMNKLGKGGVLKVGMRLRVPKDDEGLPVVLGDNKAAKDDSDSASKKELGSQVASAGQFNATSMAAPAAGIEPDHHVVQSGENLSTIAKKYGVTIEALRRANNLGRKTLLRVGSQLVIPQGNVQKSPATLEGGARQPANSRYRIVADKKRRAVVTLKKKPKVHVVRRGENLSKIAARYGVSLESIKRQNQLSSHSKVMVGSRLLIPLAEAAQ